MSSKSKSRRWFKEHSSDVFVQRAAVAGYRSRAAYKLLELDQREKLLRKGMAVVDLGATPGGWAQVVAAKVSPVGVVVAVDRLPLEPIAGVHFIRGDFLEEPVKVQLMTELPDRMADLVISDMAPNLTGVKITDQVACEDLVIEVLDFAAQVLKPGGTVLAKVFQGAGLQPVLTHARLNFDKVRIRKPKASRARSAESYLLAQCRSGILNQ